MNRLFTTALSTLSLIAIASPTFAVDVVGNTTRVQDLNNQIAMQKSSLTSTTTINQISPVNLVQISYQGFLENQGIPSGGKFVFSVNQGKIDAQTLVKSGIAKGRLSPQTLTDNGYLNTVQTELDSLNVD